MNSIILNYTKLGLYFCILVEFQVKLGKSEISIVVLGAIFKIYTGSFWIGHGGWGGGVKCEF